MSYKQITEVERYLISEYRIQGLNQRQIADKLDRHRSTISREVRRNHHMNGWYHAPRAQEHANGRRSRSRKVSQFDSTEWSMVSGFLKLDWSPEQVSLVFDEHELLSISHETIYRYIRKDRKDGGHLYKHLRHSRKQRRKGYGSRDSRGVLCGKRDISERPPAAQQRSEKGHVEIDLVHGARASDCILTMVDRKSRWVAIRKLKDKTMEEVSQALILMIRRHQIKTLTADNGSEFHDYKRIEKLTGATFYFAKPYHSWERGTCENTNGLIRQYIPKQLSMADISQWDCNAIAYKLNSRPRKVLDLFTPAQAHYDL
jgi:IS30 family transposase